MNEGYRKLSKIDYPASSTESAFWMIGEAYGSVGNFFKLLEAQRHDLESYAHSCLYKEKYLEGLILLKVSNMAIGWGKNF
jgi:hypothetical protein